MSSMEIQKSSALSVSKSRTLKSTNVQKKTFILLSLIPAMALFLIFMVIPMILSIVYSFYNYDPLSSNPPFIGLKNYLELIQDKVFLKSLTNTFYFVSVSVILNLIIATILAVVVNNVVIKKHKDIFRTIFFLPTTANIAAVAVIWAYIYDRDYGMINMLLSKIGMHSSLYWLGTSALVIPAVIIMNLWQDMGYNIVIIIAGLEGIPKMFFEAATIDGANKVQIFFKITLPLLTRTMLFVSVMTVISYFQVFTQAYVLTRGGADHASEFIALNIYLNAFNYSRLGYASAGAVVLLVIILVISFLQFKFIKTDWEY